MYLFHETNNTKLHWPSLMSQAQTKKGQSGIMRLLRRKRTTSSSSDADDDLPRTPTSPKSSPRMYGTPLIGKIPLTPLTKTSPRSEQRASWGRDQLIGGKYDVTSKDKSVLERISHRAHRHGARVRKPHEVMSVKDSIYMSMALVMCVHTRFCCSILCC